MIPKDKELLYVPLGGSGEIGQNMGLYGQAGQWVMVDCGVGFADDTNPGLDLLVADPAFIEDQAERLAGIVLTHAHEDHVGAVGWLWRRLRAPIYASPFTMAMVKSKLEEAGIEPAEVSLHTVYPGQPFRVGPFDLEFIHVTHSIPEAHSVVLRTANGTVLHTADWKLDPDPLIGDVTDTEAFRALGDEGVVAMVCDSTNVFSTGHTNSEAAVRESLVPLIGRYEEGRIAVACFASNVARVESIAKAAQANDREVALVGRSLWRMVDIARSCGYMQDAPAFLTEHDAAYIPDDRILYICTGSQGEAKAALSRVAQDNHPHVTLDEGDVVIFSSRVIPGNEKAIGRLYDNLARLGVEVVTERDHFVHVSGHPKREELERLYQLVRPRTVVPQHGELRHLMEHAELAPEWGAGESVLAENGQVVRLAPDPPEVIAEVPNGRLAIDGGDLRRLDGDLLRRRRRMIYNGAATATVVVDGAGSLLSAPQLSAPGLVEKDDGALHDAIVADVRQAVDGLNGDGGRDDGAVREAARLAVRRGFRRAMGKKPETEIHVVRVGA